MPDADGTTDEGASDAADVGLRPRRRRRLLIGVGATLVAVLATSGIVRQCSDDVVEHETLGTFNVLPDPLPSGQPGSLIRSERLLGAPNGAVAWRVLYHSTDLDGTPIGVSGIVVAPDLPPPDGGWPIVSWAHPTTGALGRCAPSEGLDPFLLVAGLHELLDAGYAVAATDYPGMGADGPASYLIGVSEGNSVLDAARAARAIPEAHAGTELFLWGHSQGGQAALFAAQQAQAYAPELTLRGVAVAAPAAELGELLDDHRNDVSGVTIGSYAFDALVKVYGPKDPNVRLDAVLTPGRPVRRCADRAALPALRHRRAARDRRAGGRRLLRRRPVHHRAVEVAPGGQHARQLTDRRADPGQPGRRRRAGPSNRDGRLRRPPVQRRRARHLPHLSPHRPRADR